jgi:hypothetical protein
MFDNYAKNFLEMHPAALIKIFWIKGHQRGNLRSAAVDTLAKEAVSEVSTLAGPTIAWQRENAKIKVTKEWQADWQRERLAHPNRLCCAALRKPPTTKCPRHLKRVDIQQAPNGPPDLIPVLDRRKALARLNQCLSGNGWFGESSQIHRPWADDPVRCRCGVAIQTRSHILRDCPRYAAHRHILRNVTRSLDLRELFSTDRGLAALLAFLTKSNAFSPEESPTADTARTTRTVNCARCARRRIRDCPHDD